MRASAVISSSLHSSIGASSSAMARLPLTVHHSTALQCSLRLYTSTTRVLCAPPSSSSGKKQKSPRFGQSPSPKGSNNNNSNISNGSGGRKHTNEYADGNASSFSSQIREDLARHSPTSAEQRGIFQSQHIKPFPVRAAIDIGTGGVISLSIARVDAHVGAIQKLMYQTQLPLYLEKVQRGATHTADQHSTSSASSAFMSNRGSLCEGEFTLSERTLDDIRNKMRILHGAMRRNAFEGLSERAAVLSWPLCCAANAPTLARDLTREFKVDVRVLGVDFNVAWPPSVARLSASPSLTPFSSSSSSSSSSANEMRRDAQHSTKTHAQEIRAMAGQQGNSLKALLRKTSVQHSKKEQTSAAHRIPQRGGDNVRDTDSNQKDSSVMDDPQLQVDALAFLAHAAVSQCVAPQRLLVLSEDPQRGVRLLGLDTSAAADVADLIEGADSPEAIQKLQHIAFGSTSSSTFADINRNNNDDRSTNRSSVRATKQNEDGVAGQPWMEELKKKASGGSSWDGDKVAAEASSLVPVVPPQPLRILQHVVPVDVAAAHRYCITNIQHRPADLYHLHTSSPNPLLPEEFATLRDLLTSMTQHDLPAWVRRKAQLGGMLVATSHNGGLANVAARVAQQTHVSLDHLEVHAQHHFCGLTDVLLAETFPNPFLVLPSAALFAAVLRAVESPRLLYLPEVNVAAALLVQPSLWVASRSAEVRRRLSRDPFYAATTSAQRGRVFERPHRKENPSAAPEARWATNSRLDPLSYEQSMKGT